MFMVLNLLNAYDFVTIDNSTAHFAGASGKTTLLSPKGKGKHWAWSHENTKVYGIRVLKFWNK